MTGGRTLSIRGNGLMIINDLALTLIFLLNNAKLVKKSNYSSVDSASKTIILKNRQGQVFSS